MKRLEEVHDHIQVKKQKINMGIKMKWPVYFKNRLEVGNLDSEVAIVTLWTKREEVSKAVDKGKYAVIGQLYSKDEGLNALLRNCLANKTIRNIVIVGKDLTNSGEALIKLFENGMDKENMVIGVKYAFVDKEISKDAIDNLRENVKVYDYRELKDFSGLNKIIDKLPKEGSYGKPEIFPESKIRLPQVFPSEKTGFVVREDYIGDAWLRILGLVMKFGVVKKSQYDVKQKEIINLMVTIKEEDPDDAVWKDFYQFTEQDLENYIPTVTTAKPYSDIEYTYGQRLRNFRGIDQIANVIEELKAHSFTRRAVACTWDVVKDIKSDKAPCLDLVQCLVQDGKLYLTAFFRSNDMFGAWPMNVYALRRLQKMIAKGLDVEMGHLTTFSCSAHIYKNNWSKANEILEGHSVSTKELGDPRGNFRISVEYGKDGKEGKIKVVHMSPEGKRIDEFEGERAIDVYRKMEKEARVHDQFHAFDLGAELQKAEIALENGLEYNQDQRLNLKNSENQKNSR